MGQYIYSNRFSYSKMQFLLLMYTYCQGGKVLLHRIYVSQYAFYMVYSHWLWQLPQTALYLDIIITGYYVLHNCNLEQFENKVIYLLTTVNA